jgi:hypothetical protein
MIRSKLFTGFLIGIVVLSIVMNFVLYRLNNLGTQKADTQFITSIEQLRDSFRYYEDKSIDINSSLRNSSSFTGAAVANYNLSSFSKTNMDLHGNLYELNNVFINPSAPKILSDINDLSKILGRIHDNPNDLEATEQLRSLLWLLHNKQ